MPVFDVTLTAPNGNTVSRPIVAVDADEAITEMEIDHQLNRNDPSVTIVAKERADPDGHLERVMNDALMRRMEQEFSRLPAPRRRVRR